MDNSGKRRLGGWNGGIWLGEISVGQDAVQEKDLKAEAQNSAGRVGLGDFIFMQLIQKFIKNWTQFDVHSTLRFCFECHTCILWFDFSLGQIGF